MPKIYDAFCFFNEFEILSLRLNILDPYVDYFVLCESSTTHSGQPKPFYFEENKEGFSKFLHKIIHVKITDTPDSFVVTPQKIENAETKKMWDFVAVTSTFNRNMPSEMNYGRDFWQKESIRHGLVNCSDDDIIISSDCDEIPNPEILKRIDSYFFDPNKFFSFQQNSYYFYLNMLKETDWLGSRMGTYGELKNYSYNELRKQTNVIIPNGGWHFSFQGGAESVKHKLESYCHSVDMNTEEYRGSVEKNMQEGIDPFFRGKLQKVEIDDTFPEYLRQNISRYTHMVKSDKMEQTNTPTQQEERVITQPTDQPQNIEGVGILGREEVKDSPIPKFETPPIPPPKKIANTLVISNYNNDVSWAKDYNNPFVIYDRSDDGKDRSALKVIKSPNVGYNLADYFTFIVDNYDNLPEYTAFIKGNIFPRHMTKKRFEELKDLQCFTPLFDHTYKHTPQMPMCMFSCDGGWSEKNNGIALPDPAKHPTKYVSSYNDLLNLLFLNPLIPEYITFAAGGMYVVPKNNILKYSKIFYENLRFIISHCQLAGETHLVERALYTIWMGNFKPNPKFNDALVNDATFMINKWSSIPTRNIGSTQPPSKSNQVYTATDNLRTICTIKLKECERPFYPAREGNINIDGSIFPLVFDSIKFDDCQFIFENITDAEGYLSSVLLPKMKGEANATFVIDKSYKRK